MKLLKESECAKHFKLLKALEDPERVRRVVTEEKRHKAASYDAKLAKAGKGRIGKNMRQLVSIDPLDYYALCLKYGKDEVHSKGFIKHYQREYPEHTVHKV